MNDAHNTSEADYSVETWVIHPGGNRTIDVADVERLRAGMVAGNISIIGHDGDDTRIEIETVVEHEVHVTLDHGALQINQPKRTWKDTFVSVASFTRARTSSSITVMLPRHVSVKVGTVSAEVLVTGMRSGASVNTASGDIQLSDVKESIDINTASGRVDIDGLNGILDMRSVSGELTVSGSSERLSLETVSGNALLDLEGNPSLISVNSVSGDVTARLDAGPGLSADFKSISGNYAVDGNSGRGNASPHTTGEPVIRISCNSVSGNLTVVRR